jgi:prephenate dehydrogenase
VSVSIKSFETVLQKLVQEIEQITDYRPLVVDVLSVKEYPIQLMTKHLSTKCDVLATHPMFGPDSCPTSNWSDQPLVYSKIRIQDITRFNSFMYPLQECNLIEMEGSVHDQCASSSQFIAHLVGNIMGELDLGECPIDTATYKSLLRIRDLIKRDSKDLFQGLYCFNQFSQASLDKFQSSVAHIVSELKQKQD